MLRTGEVVAALPGMTDDGFGNPVASVSTGDVNSSEQGVIEPEAQLEGAEALVSELKKQRSALQARENEILMREQKMKALEMQLRERLEEVRAARDSLAKTAALVADAASKDVAKLAQMYQQMKPKQAGQIFNEMAPSFAAGFISEMRPDAAALIMAQMDAEKAYAVSLLLAGRNLKN